MMSLSTKYVCDLREGDRVAVINGKMFIANPEHPVRIIEDGTVRDIEVPRE